MLKSLCFIAIAANVILSVSATGSSGVCGGRLNERWVQCPNDCGPKNCSEVGYPKPCPRSSDSSHCLSKPGCVCEDGFVRNDYGKCIPITSCPCCGGDENAVSGCGNCPITCSNYKIKDQISCIQICYPNACDCKKGYVRDENIKKCVKLQDCTPQCGKNETFSTCANGGCHTGRTCDDLKKLNGSEICIHVKKCEPGCLCKNGYVRDIYGVCIPENDCPYRKCSGCNEHWEQCPDICRPSNCSQVGNPIPCPRSSDNSSGYCTGLSKPGCVCDDGYVKYKGNCIPIKNCPSCGGDENAVSGCGNCPTTCSNYKIKDQISCLQICYPNACDCKKGYVLDDNTKKCVKLQDCTPQCGKNETFSTCVNGGCHTGRTCDELKRLNGSTICVRPEKCQPGCFCKKGYVRDSNGVCIPENDCPSKKCSSRKNEHWEQSIDDCIPRSCSELGYPLACKVLNSNGTCPTKSGCVCDDGLVWNDKGICIPAKQCPSCGGDKNAESGCGNCRKTCRSLNSHKPPICPLYCNLNGCNCKEGYVYDEITDKCVLPKNCSPPCGSKEVFDYCVNGGCHHGRTCKELDSFNGSTICIDPIKCLKGCLCEEGYVRNNAGECIPEYECPGKNCGGRKNEQFVECPNDCAPKKCSELGYPVGCPGQTVDGSCPVKAGCVCDSGFKRADNGTCIPIQQCPSCGGDENAHSGCGNCPKTCSNYNSTEPQICLQYCDLNGCDCNEGYVLDEIVNKCVLPKNCSPPCGKNEELNYCVNGGCHEAKTCKDLDTINGTLICENPTECKRGCACKYGYLRDSKGVCIPENKCPNSKCKGELETYVPCNYKCAPERCDQLGYPLNCLLPSKGPCPGKPACLCRVGYVRNIKGKCIPLDQCPSCGGDPNARSGCGGYCGRRCSNYNKGPIACPLVCQINGCDCLDGFVYDDNIGKCVPPEKCTPVCGQNEQYTSCIENCSEGRCGQKSNSNSVSSRHCTVGCVCRDGFVRNSNGVCVAKNECSLNDKCSARPYEFWDTCPPNCSPETCSSIGQVIDCPPQAAVCRPRCRCAEGYKRNDRGMCIPEIQCNQCGKNETYDLCFSPCPPQVCGTNIAAISCLRIEPEDCKGGCRCQDDYYRNKQGDCVAENDCPPENPCTKANEVYDVCPSKCPPRVCGIDDTLIDCAPGPNPGDPDCPPPTCRCANGYYRDNKGQCVKWKNCPKCPKHQVYDPCPNPCPPQLCSVDERVIKCKAPPQVGDDDCKAGCRCEDGYKKNDTGICIPKEQCPSPLCPTHEIFDLCPANCPPETCPDGRVYKCPAPPKPGSADCKPRCRCKDNYYRNEKGICIPKKQCPLICSGPHEYYACGGACDNVCSTLSQQNQTYCPIINIKCNDKCYCEEGYARDGQGICVPISSCRSCNGDPNAQPGCGCSKTCSDYYANKEPTCTKECKVGACDCKKGYVREEKTGKCILPKDCPATKCPKNEIFDLCPASCPPESCPDGIIYRCAAPPKPGSADCKPRCRCKDNYYRNEEGYCVSKDQCPQSCSGSDESWDPCPDPCAPTTCEDLYNTRACTYAYTEVKQCCGACRCNSGYFRNILGQCISKENCLKCTKPHEYFSCGVACDNVCATLSQQNQTSCPIINVKCNEKCYCEKDYARDSNDNCIPISSCPSCNGDPNAEPGCCGQTCSNYNATKELPCNKFCTQNICQCKKGYALDESSGKCVLPKNCPCE